MFNGDSCIFIVACWSLRSCTFYVLRAIIWFLDYNCSLTVSDSTSCDDNVSGGNQADLIEEQVRNSSSNSPTSPVSSESRMSDRKAGVPQNLDNMGLIGLVRDGGRSFSLSESQQQQQDPPEMANFSVSS